MLDYVPLVFFFLGGIALAFAARFQWIYGMKVNPGRSIMSTTYYSLSALAASFAVVWWQAVILGKGGTWAILKFFPLPGIFFAAAVLAVQVFMSRLIWKVLDEDAERFWSQYQKH